MRLIAMLISLLIVGLLVKHQLSSAPPSGTTTVEGVAAPLPNVPQRPEDVKKFDNQINAFVIDADAARKKKN